MTDPDIVTRLRKFARDFSFTDTHSDFSLTEAADEIERLRVIVQGWEHSARNAERDMATLRAERDEARREVCSMNETGLRMNESDKKREAKRRAWDCFKEDGK